MGFYIRKSFSFGPLRLNLSRSGLGVSFGVTGARIGVGPRGAYIHAGRGGLYYRQSLSPRRARSSPGSPAGSGGAGHAGPWGAQDGDPSAARDAGAAGARDAGAWGGQDAGPWGARDAGPAGAGSGAWPVRDEAGPAHGETRPAREQTGPARDEARPTRDQTGSAHDEALAEVPLTEIESADIGQLVDASAADLLEELNRVQARRQLVPAVAFCLAFLGLVLAAGGAPLWAYALAGLAGLAGLLWARHLDVTRGTAVLHYDLEADAERTFSQLEAAFGQLAACRAVWHVEASAAAGDARRQAGAGTLVKRRPITPAPASTPPRVACNLAVPALPAGRQTLYFFPDRVLVYEQKRVGAVPYGALAAQAEAVRFVETGAVPADAEVVETTWQYVRKDGGPDRRFRDNPQLPVVRYGELHLTSPSGLNELFQCSRAEAAAAVASALGQQRAAGG